MKRYLLVLCLFSSFFLYQNVFAHSMFIQSGRYVVQKGKDSPLFFSYGHIVPFGDGLRPEKIAGITVSSPDRKAVTIPVRQEKGLQSHMIQYDRAGIWTLTSETTPGYYTVYVDNKGREHHAIKPISAVTADAEKIILSYLSKQYAKSYVVCETPENAPLPVAGLALELMPSSSLFFIKPGQYLEFQVLKDGKPFTGEGSWDATFAGFSTQPEDLFYPPKTIQGGRFRVFIAHPGRWFIRYNIKFAAEGAEKKQYRQLKLATSFVFQVDNERLRVVKKKKQ